MFNCYAHGWSHIERLCPACSPTTITTTNINTGYVPPAPPSIPSNEQVQKMQELEAKLAVAVEALEYLARSPYLGHVMTASQVGQYVGEFSRQALAKIWGEG